MANSYEDRSWTRGSFTSFQGGQLKIRLQPDTDVLACGYWKRFLDTIVVTPEIVVPNCYWQFADGSAIFSADGNYIESFCLASTWQFADGEYILRALGDTIDA